jgi:signal transduction histidine kinase
VGNAAKFTRKGAITIDVEAATDAEHPSVVIVVADTGVGMTQEQIGRVFDAFTQADVNTTRKYGGTGLGLAIVSRFCGLMGGHVSAESEPGRGSRFIVRLPLDVSAVVDAAAVDAA